MGKRIVLCQLILVLFFCMAAQVEAASVSRDAQRHFNRGMAAVKRARTPKAYEAAIKHFQKAQAIAPSWPDVYYNLGLVQDKASKHRDALASLRKYLQLEPSAFDSATVRALFDRVEYKVEQEITGEEILNIFGSLDDPSKWKRKNLADQIWGNPGLFHGLVSIRRAGAQIVVTYHTNDPRDPGRSKTHRLTPDGNKLSCKTHRYMGDNYKYYQEVLFQLEIVSRNVVKMTRTFSYPKRRNANTDRLVFQRK